MSIAFLANDASEFGGVAYNLATAGEFDANYTDKAISVTVPINNGSPSPVQFYAGTIAGDLWVHFRLKTPSVGTLPSLTSIGTLMSFKAADGTEIARIQVKGSTATAPNNGWHATAYGDTTVNGAVFTGQYGSATVTYDIQITSNSTSIIINVYSNGTLVSSATAANSSGLKGKPAFVSWPFDNSHFHSSGTTILSLSEVVATDGESTVGWRVAALKPNANGANTAWLGSVTDIQTVGDGLAITSGTAGQRESWTLSAYAGASSPSSIRGLVAKIRGSKGSSGPGKITPMVRFSSTNYDKTALTPDGTVPIYADWTTNPNTGVSWTTGDLATVEMGVLSAT